MSLSQEQHKVLQIILEKLSKQDLEWALTGGTSFILQGLEYETSDIDIQRSEDAAYEIEDLLSEYIIEDVHLWESEKMKSHFGKLEINDVEVEVMGAVQKKIDGAWENPVDVSKNSKTVTYKNFEVPVLELEYEAEPYEKLDCERKAEKLRELAEQDTNLA